MIDKFGMELQKKVIVSLGIKENEAIEQADKDLDYLAWNEE